MLRPTFAARLPTSSGVREKIQAVQRGSFISLLFITPLFIKLLLTITSGFTMTLLLTAWNVPVTPRDLVEIATIGETALAPYLLVADTETESRKRRMEGPERGRGVQPDVAKVGGPPSLEVWTGHLLHWVSQQARDRYMDALNGLHLSPLQVGILQLLAVEGPFVQARLGERLRMDKGALSREVANLVDQRLVMRQPHGGDRRASVVVLCVKGQERLVEAERVNAAVTQEFFAPLTDGEIAHLHVLLRRLGQHDDRRR